MASQQLRNMNRTVAIIAIALMVFAIGNSNARKLAENDDACRKIARECDSENKKQHIDPVVSAFMCIQKYGECVLAKKLDKSVLANDNQIKFSKSSNDNNDKLIS
jgi:uncharacterized protein YdaU (DUF1376 family)